MMEWTGMLYSLVLGGGRDGLLLKRWTPLFDPCTEKYDTLPIWVKMPNLPFEFWSLDFFKLVGNSLGSF